MSNWAEAFGMKAKSIRAMKRREFLKLASAASLASLAGGARAESNRSFAIVFNSTQTMMPGSPVRWAAEKLRDAFEQKGARCQLLQSALQVQGNVFGVELEYGYSSKATRNPYADEEVIPADGFHVIPKKASSRPGFYVAASSQRGYVYALLELAERIRFGADPMAALNIKEEIAEKPANDVRSVGRYFCSEIEDTSWYTDKAFWPDYLDMLAASRFNRFCLAFGLAYDFPRGVTDDYLHFPYPYLVDVPGYADVRVMRLRSANGEKLPQPVPLSAEERNRNFEMLKYIAAETGKRGLDFQLGLWTHAYEWTDSPNAYHDIEGLTPQTHAQYCRDALAIILRECPQIQGLTMRVHGESGIPEGSYDFWTTVFEAVFASVNKVEIDMHAKGVDRRMIDIASLMRVPVKLGAKFSAEHQSLGYQQADIRALEIPRAGREQSTLFSLSSGSRSFTRYGYADFFQEGSKARLLFRLWPGTQRHLLSADPEMAAAYGRTSHFCDAAGLDLMEPLTFKGREGSGHKGGRCAYADESLNPKADWKKFEFFYRVWGRKLYDPEAPAEAWRRFLRVDFGEGAAAVETALGNASRVLPLLTSAHLPSASNHSLWYDIYTNMPIVQGSEKPPYSDTPEPRCFGTVSPLDSQLFSTIVEHAQDLLTGRLNAKYSPIEVAQWIEDYTAASDAALVAARVRATSRRSPGFRRMEEDVLIQNGMGAFFAAKLRSGVLYEIYQQTGNQEAGKLALAQYRKAREAWAKMAERAKGVYRSDVSYGDVPMRRGHWSDRLAGIDVDLQAMEAKVQAAPESRVAGDRIAQAVRAAMGRPSRPSVVCVHKAPESFKLGEPLRLSLVISGSAGRGAPTGVHLHYRHVNQAERWLSTEMEANDGSYSAAIPGDYTKSAYPLQYYFELARGSEAAWLFPAFNATLSNQPYFAIAKRSA